MRRLALRYSPSVVWRCSQMGRWSRGVLGAAFCLGAMGCNEGAPQEGDRPRAPVHSALPASSLALADVAGVVPAPDKAAFPKSGQSGAATGGGPPPPILLVMVQPPRGDLAPQAVPPRTFRFTVTTDLTTATVQMDGGPTSPLLVRTVTPGPARALTRPRSPVTAGSAVAGVPTPRDEIARRPPERAALGSSPEAMPASAANLNPNGAPIID